MSKRPRVETEVTGALGTVHRLIRFGVRRSFPPCLPLPHDRAKWYRSAGLTATHYREPDLNAPAIEAMKDRTSRPRRSPHRTRRVTVRKMWHLTGQTWVGTARIGHKFGVDPSV